MGNIFTFILHKKDFNTDCIVTYKDQKAYLYFDSGFVGPVFIYEPTSKQRGNMRKLRHGETEAACQWNKGTRKEVEPKCITDLFVRKKLGSKQACRH